MHPYFQDVLARTRKEVRERYILKELSFSGKISAYAWLGSCDVPYMDAVLSFVAGDPVVSQEIFRRCHATLDAWIRACEGSAEARGEGTIPHGHAIRAYWQFVEALFLRNEVRLDLMRFYRDMDAGVEISLEEKHPSSKRDREYGIWRVALADLALRDFVHLETMHRRVFGVLPDLKSKSFFGCRRDKYKLILRLTQYVGLGEAVPVGLQAAAKEFANDSLLNWDDLSEDALPYGVSGRDRPLFLWILLDTLGMQESVDDLCARMREQKFLPLGASGKPTSSP